MLNNGELVEKRVEEIWAFVSELTGPNYQSAMIQRFPLATLNFFPQQKLPYLGEDQVWVCNCGCGERDPVMVPSLTLCRVGIEGLIEADVEGIWVSPCTVPGFEPEDGVRHFGMSAWDNYLDDEVDPPIRLRGDE